MCRSDLVRRPRVKATRGSVPTLKAVHSMQLEVVCSCHLGGGTNGERHERARTRTTCRSCGSIPRATALQQWSRPVGRWSVPSNVPKLHPSPALGPPRSMHVGRAAQWPPRPPRSARGGLVGGQLPTAAATAERLCLLMWTACSAGPPSSRRPMGAPSADGAPSPSSKASERPMSSRPAESLPVAPCRSMPRSCAWAWQNRSSQWDLPSQWPPKRAGPAAGWALVGR